MAGFSDPADALSAALEMVDRVRETALAHGVEDLSIRIALHEGPCLVVRANERLDFFGTKVNLASRLLGRAAANRIVMLSSLAGHPGIARILTARALKPEAFRAELRGLSAERELVSIRVEA